MKRGELWTLRDNDYSAKARPVVIVQADLENNFDSIILCLFTTYASDNISTRIKIEPSNENGLVRNSYVMTDKIVTVDKALLGSKIGILSNDEMHQISGKLAKILNIHKNDIEDAD